MPRKFPLTLGLQVPQNVNPLCRHSAAGSSEDLLISKLDSFLLVTLLDYVVAPSNIPKTHISSQVFADVLKLTVDLSYDCPAYHKNDLQVV